MKKRVLLVVLFRVVSLFTFSIGTAGEVIDRILEHGYLTLGTTGEQPPMSIRNKNGEMMGLDVDLALLMAMAMGVKLSIEQMPFEELIPALEKGTVDVVISSMTITPDRNLKQNFLDELNQCWLYCPDDVILKAYAFLDTVHTGAATDDATKESHCGDLVAAIRRDLLSRKVPAKTQLTSKHFRHLYAT